MKFLNGKRTILSLLILAALLPAMIVAADLNGADLGDAPDSTNHFGMNMTAYAFPLTQANFPTVFDPATGLPQGPAHNAPRPLRLGQQVSREQEADIGADEDPSNNILPNIDIADMDRGDDGVALGPLSFADCQTTTINYQVTITPAAVNYFQQNGGEAYLNVWVDGIRDGDWDDIQGCPANPELPSFAAEHIVIDHNIDVVALGAGTHNLTVLTNRVPWPVEQEQYPAWMRFTLSETESNKTYSFTGGEGQDYGDGRGYSNPFQLGETEDYLFNSD